MKTTRLPRLLGLLIIFLLGLSGQNLRAAAGDLDPLDVSISGGQVLTTVLQPDGKMIVGGSFTAVLGLPRNRIARINPDGTLDSGFDPNANGTVESIVVRADGKILLGGFFTTLQPGSTGPVLTRQRMARLNADGTLDAGFDPNANQEVLSMAEQADGKIVIVGRFSSLQPNGAAAASTRNRVARLNADGTLDTSFAPSVAGGGGVYSLAIQADGKILIAGYFTAVGSTSRTNIARLNVNGSLDTAFNPGASGSVNSIAVQADGKILAGGDFLSIASYGRNRIARLNADGTADSGFYPGANNTVYSMAVQADGKILIAGYFTTISSAGSVARGGIARLLPNGTLDTGFDPKANAPVNCVALRADGGILMGGYFTSLQPNNTGTAIPRAGFARLYNDPATRTLTVPTNNQATLTPGGSTPDCVRVSFQLSTDGATWTPLGTGTRAGLSPTWRLNNLSLPSNGRIRALGVTSDANGSTGGLIENVVAFENLAPLPISAIFNGTSTAPADERLNDSGTVFLGAAAQTFTIRNTGLADLTGLSLSLSGANPGDFTLGSLGATVLPPGATTSFTVTFSPTALGLRNAVVSLVSNDSDRSPFRINLSNLLPGIEVSGGGMTITNGDDTPMTGDSTDFGNISVFGNNSTQVRTFNINNRGAAGLTLGGVTISGENAADFTVSQQPGSTVGANHGTVFTIIFDPSAVGLRRAIVSFESNDAGKTPFHFSIQGTGFVSNNAALSDLTGSPGTLGPLFSTATTTYTASVPYGDAAFTITPKTAEVNATLAFRINGGSYTSIPSNSSSPPLPLEVGTNIVELRVTAQDGTTTQSYSISVSRAAARPGDLDPLVSNVSSAEVNAIAIQPDGKTIIAGQFGSIQGIWRSGIARLNADGSIDTGFDPQVSGLVRCVALQGDGKILLGGSFNRLQPNGATSPVTRNNIARLNADGSLDTSFNPEPNGPVRSVAQQADGKILVGGEFTTLQPAGATAAIPRNRLARLNPDGTLDAGFDPRPNNSVYSVVVQTDGRILLGGTFTTLQPGGAGTPTTIKFIARVNTDGTIDNGFNPTIYAYVNAIAVQKDGKVLFGGYLSIARVESDGTSDTTFYPGANGSVTCVAIQTDGKVLFGGEFYTLRPNNAASTTSRSRIARMNADGTLDTSFDPGAGDTVSSIALQADGRILLGGKFTSFKPNGASSTTSRGGFARVLNQPATESLTIPSASRIEWLRGGSSPEVESVTFESSIDRGASYTRLGAGTRINGGWEINGPSVPSGQIRARGRTAGGLVEAVTVFGITATPEIDIIGNGRSIPNGATSPALADHTDFGNVLLFGTGSTLTRTFTINNTGATDLTLGAITINGANAADFTIVQQPVSPVLAGRSTNVTITFDPGAVGLRSATVSIANNDADESPSGFDIQGTGFISNNADLSNLWVLATKNLAPEFSPAITAYAINVPYGDESVRVASYTAEPNASISVRMNGGARATVESTSLSDALPITVGANTLEVQVTAQDGKTKTYTVTVNRAPAGAGDLSPLNAYIDGGVVNALAVQPDGGTIIAGSFNSVMGVERNNIARINADGTLDAGFDPHTDNSVYSVVVQADGKLVIGGEFSTLLPDGAITATTRNRMARLNPDGTLDTTFDPNANDTVFSMSVQPGGKILLGGMFTTLQPNGAAAATTRNHIARINADGTLDTGFDPNANNNVLSIAVQMDGKILLGGGFTTLQPNGAAVTASRQYVARVNGDGSLDPGFDPKANNYVLGLAIQSDEKVLLGGTFTTLQPNGAATPTTRNRIARLDSGGNLDTGFDPNPDSNVSSMLVQADGKILVSGEFSALRPNGAVTDTIRHHSALLNPDGTPDPAFDPNTNYSVRGAALQSNGQVLLGGEFISLQPNGSVSSVYRVRFARILNSPATGTLAAPNATLVSWTRGGSSPEVSQVTFELSTDDGASYTTLGNATRSGNTPNWQLDGLTLPAGGFIRARGRTAGGYLNGSSGLVESVASFGTAGTSLALWRQSRFGSPANTGSGADNSDPDHDGLVNLIEYAFGLNPTVPDTALLPQLQRTGGNLSFIFTPPSGIGGITYGAEWSNDFSSWNSITDTGSAPQRVFTVTAAGKTALFVRLTVTAP